MKAKKVLAVLLSGAMVTGLTGCSSSDSSSASSSKASSSSSSSASSNTYITDAVVEDQLAPPEIGEQIAVINVEGYGTIKCRLFPEAAPKAVENFVTLAEQGQYNGDPFHRVIEDFMIQTGDTTLTGGDGQSIYGSGFEVELNESLHHYNGALAAARTDSKSSGQSTQFYIVSSQGAKEDVTDSQWENLKKTANLTDETIATYKEVGGYPSLDMQYTVFGQVFEGQDVVDAIAACPKDSNPGSDGALSVPNPPVTISSIEITTYNG